MILPLTRQEIARYRRRLLERLSRLAGDVQAVQQNSLEPSGGERYQDVDESIEETSLATDLATLTADDREGYEIGEALERIEQGTYGRCESCDAWIGRPRLDLLPETALCSSCARVRARERG